MSDILVNNPTTPRSENGIETLMNVLTNILVTFVFFLLKHKRKEFCFSFFK